MDAVLQDIRFAFRALLRQPALTLSVVLTLALGVGLNGTVYSIVNAYLFRPLPARDAHEIVLLGSTTPELAMPHEMSWPDFEDYARLPVFQDAAGWVNQTVNLGAAGGRAERAYIGEVTANYFALLGVPAALGRTFAAGEDREPGGHRVIVLTHDFWQRHFGGDSSVVDRTVPINGRAATIVGVLPASFRPVQSLLDLAFYMPLNQAATDYTRQYKERDAGFINVAARLAPGIGVGEARAAAQALAERIAREYPATSRDRGVVLVAEKRARPILFVSAATPLASAVFLTLTTLVLLVACANVAGLLLSRTAARERELSVRAALGASRGRIARLLVCESLLLGGAGGLMAIAVASWSATTLASLRIATDAPVRFDVAPDWRVFAITLLTALGAGTLAGLGPAWRAAAADPHAGLKAGARTGGLTRQRLRATLVVSQVAVAIVVLVCAGMFVRAVQSAARIDLGFRAQGILLASVSPADQGYDRARTSRLADRMIEQAGRIPGVRGVAIARRIPIGYNNSTDRIEPDGGLPGGAANFTAFTNVVSPGYFEAMGIPLLSGRAFERGDDSTAPRVAIISRAFADQVFPGSAVGRRFRWAGDTTSFAVVGVVENTVWMSAGEPGRPFIYYALGQRAAADMTLHVRADGDPSALVPALRAVMSGLDADLPLYDVRSLREHLDNGRAFFFLRLGAALAAAFGLIALALGAVGLFGLVAFGVAQRTREIGIRLALGDDAAGVQRLMVRRGLKLVAIGLAIGLPVAVLATRGLTGLLVGVPPRDPLVLAGGVIVLLLVTIVAAWLPARRAAAVDPMVALRSD